MFSLWSKDKKFKENLIFISDAENFSPLSSEFSRLCSLLDIIGEDNIDVAFFQSGSVKLDKFVLQGLKKRRVVLREIKKPHRKSGSKSPHGKLAGDAFNALEALKPLCFKSIFFFGPLHWVYYILQDKFLGRNFCDTAIRVHVDRTFLERTLIGQEKVCSYADLAKIFMERKVLERCDELFSFSSSVFDKLDKYKFEMHMDKKKLIQQKFPAEYNTLRLASRHKQLRLDTVLFIGTLDHVGGLTTFIYALNELHRTNRISAIKRILISGRANPNFPSPEFIQEASNKIGRKIEILPVKEATAFYEFILEKNLLVVVASNYFDRPAVVDHLIALNAPVLLSKNIDLTPNEVPEYYTFDGNYIDLSKKMNDVFLNGFNVNIDGYYENVPVTNKDNALKFSNLQPVLSRKVVSKNPLISVCIAHFNRYEMLRATVDSVIKQSYDNFEIIIVDDGSSRENLLKVQQLADGQDKIRVISQPNLYLGAARNTGAKYARGEYLLFKDDDNLSRIDEIEKFVRAALHSGADITVCFSENFKTGTTPDEICLDGIVRLPFGADPIYGMLKNGLGDSNCFVKTKAWKKLKGFSEHYKIGLDDQEFFLRAVLSGCSLEVLPEALYYYRLGGLKMKRFHASMLANEERILNPILKGGLLDEKSLPLVKLLRNIME
jgi:O-antigen biosynthesis protein